MVIESVLQTRVPDGETKIKSNSRGEEKTGEGVNQKGKKKD
jgi:hypothetical protein